LSVQGDKLLVLNSKAWLAMTRKIELSRKYESCWTKMVVKRIICRKCKC